MMQLKDRIKKLERMLSEKGGDEIEMTIRTIISDRREVLLGEAEPDPSLGDRVEERTIRCKF